MTHSLGPIDSCIACHAPFPVTRELAAVPAAKRVAFDPALGRVWRICTKCGHWNLLGPETSIAAAAELRLRLPSSGARGIVHDSIGKVGVITVSTDAGADAAGVEGLRTRRLLDWVGRFRYLWPITPFVGILGALFYMLIVDPTNIHLDIVQFLASSALGFWFAKQLSNWRLHRPVYRWHLALGALAAALLAFVVPRFAADPWFGPGLTLFIVLFQPPWEFLFLQLYTRRAVTRPDGRSLKLSKVAVRDAAVGVNHRSGEVAVYELGDGVTALGNDAISVLTTLGEFDVGIHARSDVEQGWSILRRNGALPDVLRALDASRPDQNGRHRWHDLPLPWRLALYFGAVESAGSPAERDALRRKIRRASDVAAIAEGLDS